MKRTTPRFFTRLFQWFCEEDFFEELQGDLEEKFFDHVERFGARKARNLYRKEVLLMIRPSVLKTPKLILNLIRLSLFQIHLKLALRNLARNKTFSFVNIMGLASAICLCLFLVNLLYTGYSYDGHHKEVDRLYRISTEVRPPGYVPYSFGTTTPAIKSVVNNEIPEIELISVLEASYWAYFEKNGNKISAHGFRVDRNFFELFDFETLEGDPLAIFDTGQGIVITEELSSKLYGEESALGKKAMDGSEIVAVLARPSTKSHIDFQALTASKIPHENLQGRLTELPPNSEDYTQAYTYVRLAENVRTDQAQQKLSYLKQRGIESEADKTVFLQLEHVKDIMFGAEHILDHNFVYGQNIALIIIGLMILVIALATFNYTSLSIARALQRAKEIGIRKVTGSSSKQIAGQFIIETVVFSLIAFVLALFAYKYFTPVFPVVMEELAGLFNPDLDIKILLIFTGFSVLTGILAGLLPAIHFARISALNAVNTQVKTKAMSLIRVRRTLTAIQLTVSMFAVFFISIAFDQYRQLLDSNLGFDQKSLVTFNTKSTDLQLLKSELKKIPEISSFTVSSFNPGVPGMSLDQIVGKDMQDTISSRFGIADSNFQKVYQTRTLKGQSFSAENESRLIPEALVNTVLLQRLRIPLDSAVGQVITHISRTDSVSKFQITGVMDRFVHDAFDFDHLPVVIIHSHDTRNMDRITVKFVPNKVQAGLGKIEEAWRSTETTQQFESRYLEDVIRDAYVFYHGLVKAFSFMGLVVVIISILGQLGIALYNAQTKVKEIGIRKVLGAKTTSIIGKLLRGTAITMVIAIAISAPFAFMISQNFFPIYGLTLEVTPYAMIRAIGLFILVIYAVIISQTWRIANQNPAESLRNE